MAAISPDNILNAFSWMRIESSMYNKVFSMCLTQFQITNQIVFHPYLLMTYICDFV